MSQIRDMEERMSRIRDTHDAKLTAHLAKLTLDPSINWLRIARAVIVLAEDGKWSQVLVLPRGARRTVQEVVTGLKLAKFIIFPGLDIDEKPVKLRVTRK